jgi:hypothetical protein
MGRPRQVSNVKRLFHAVVVWDVCQEADNFLCLSAPIACLPIRGIYPQLCRLSIVSMNRLRALGKITRSPHFRMSFRGLEHRINTFRIQRSKLMQSRKDPHMQLRC